VNDVYINRKLKQYFGELGGDQIFRLARTNELEYRRDYNGDVVQVPRYNYLDGTFWAIEKLMIVSGPNAELLPGRNVSYEPIFIFRKPNGHPMTVSEDAVLSFVHVQLFGERKKRDLVKEELDFYESQVDKLHQFLSDECSVLSIKLHVGEAIVNPKENTNGRCDSSVPSPEGNSGIQAGSGVSARSDSTSTPE
jgi:hypothetical protein